MREGANTMKSSLLNWLAQKSPVQSLIKLVKLTSLICLLVLSVACNSGSSSGMGTGENQSENQQSLILPLPRILSEPRVLDRNALIVEVELEYGDITELKTGSRVGNTDTWETDIAVLSDRPFNLTVTWFDTSNTARLNLATLSREFTGYTRPGTAVFNFNLDDFQSESFDNDADTISNLQELIDGTDPIDATSPGNSPNDDPVFDGTRPSLDNIYSVDQVEAIENIGLELNLGDTPPNVEGTFRLEPNALQSTTVPDDSPIGTEFADYDITFSNQNDETLTLDLFLESSNSTTTGSGSFIAGSGDSFTVFFVSETNTEGFVTKGTITFSGLVNSAGITNLQMAFFMLDDGGDPDDEYIPENTGRLFMDLDGFSQRSSADQGDAQRASKSIQQQSLFHTSR